MEKREYLSSKSITVALIELIQDVLLHRLRHNLKTINYFIKAVLNDVKAIITIIFFFIFYSLAMRIRRTRDL